MAILKAEGILLKSSNYRDKSKLITFYTKEHGKMRFIAKGVRDTKSRWGGSLQSMSWLRVIYYYNETRTLHLLSNAEYVESFRGIYDDFDKMNFGFRMLDLLNRTTEDSQQNEKIFELIKNSLVLLNSATKNYVNALFKFEYELAKLLGFGINPAISENVNGRYVENKIGGSYYNDSVKDYPKKFSVGDAEVMKTIFSGNETKLMNLNISKSTEIKLENFFENHFKTHIENLNLSNTKKVTH